MAAQAGKDAVDDSPPVDPTLRLSPDVSLRLEEAQVHLPDSEKRRMSSLVIPGTSSRCREVAHYNVLWAHVTNDRRAIVIAWAESTRKHDLIVKKARYALPEPPGDLNIDVDGWVEALLRKAYRNAARRKRAWILVNPHAGQGGADAIWEQQVKPIFEAAHMPLTVVRTTSAGEAVSLASEVTIDDFDMAVACSGDGLPHEIFNGLARRKDATRALSKMAVCLIPCGSGNAMSCNLYGTHRPSVAALAMVKGMPTRLDLVSITQGDKRFISFLSQAVGMIADVDILTEHLRWLGQHRFTYGFIKLALQRKTYPCDIAYKVEVDNKAEVKEHYRKKIQEKGFGQEESSPDGGGDGAKTPSSKPSEQVHMNLPPLKYGTVKDKLPNDWELVPHEKLGNFYSGNMAYMAPDANFFPAALAHDGLVDVVTINGDISPAENIKLQLTVESGHFFDSPLITYRKVSAYRIIPHSRDTNGVISIDGERAPYEPFQAEVHHGLGLTLSKNGMFEAPGPRNWDTMTNTEHLMA